MYMNPTIVTFTHSGVRDPMPLNEYPHQKDPPIRVHSDLPRHVIPDGTTGSFSTIAHAFSGEAISTSESSQTLRIVPGNNHIWQRFKGRSHSRSDCGEGENPGAGKYDRYPAGRHPERFSLRRRNDTPERGLRPCPDASRHGAKNTKIKGVYFEFL